MQSCPVRPLPLLALSLVSGLLGMGIAWWMHPANQAEHSWPQSINRLVPQIEPLPPPPARDQLTRFRPDQTLDLLRSDGTRVSIGFTSVVVDPRWTTVEFFAGWNRELEANADEEALLFTSGPTFARGSGNGDLAMRLHGDLMLANGLWPADNRAAAAGRAWVGISHSGELEFGYGPLTSQLEQRLRVFIGGLHAFTNTTEEAPESYRGVYGEMRLADVRIVYGIRPDGQLELVETADGVLFSDLKSFVSSKGFLASFLPDHASKSRLIIPGKRPWSHEHAVWVSGGKPSITRMPFLLKITPSREWHDRQPVDAAPGSETS